MDVSTFDTDSKLRDSLQDFSPYVGQAGKSKPYKIQVVDTGARTLVGYIGEEGTGETLSGTEKVIDGDMELNTGWINYGSPAVNARSNAFAYSGTYSRKLVISGGVLGGFQGSAWTSYNTTGRLYKLTARVWPVDRNDIYLSIRRGDNSGWNVENVNFPGLTLAAWNLVTLYFCEEAGGAYGFTRWWHQLAGTWYIDSVSVQRVVTLDANIGIDVYSTKHGSVKSWAVKTAAFDPNCALTYHVWGATSSTTGTSSSTSSSSSTTTTAGP